MNFKGSLTYYCFVKVFLVALKTWDLQEEQRSLSLNHTDS